MNVTIRRTVLAVVIGVTAGCGGAGPGDGLNADGGISGTGVAPAGVSMGPVSEFGSVRVNGTKLEITADTQVLVEGEATTQADLRIGHVVRVEADFDTATAERIEYFEAVRGPVESIVIVNPDTLRAALTVMGQTVSTTASTNFDNVLGPDTLRVGDIVEVSGTRDAQQGIVASYLARESVATVYRVTGQVANVDATTFEIAGLKIGYSAAERSALLPETLSDGLLVRVTGTAAGYSMAPPTLAATRIDPGLGLGVAVDAYVEAEGFITRFGGLSDFDLNGQAVDGTNALIEGGNGADLGLNARVEVEGVVDARGVVDASKIVIRSNEFIRIDATLDAVNPAAATLTLLGLTVEVPASTNIEDERSGGGGIADVGQLTRGMWLELRGFVRGATIVATRIEVEDPDTRVILLAPVSASNPVAGELTLLGLTIRASTALGTEFENQADDRVDEDEFYRSLASGTLVKVRWDPFSSTADPVDEASLEID